MSTITTTTDYTTTADLVAAFAEAEAGGWGWAGTRTAAGPDGIIVDAGTRVRYSYDDDHGTHSTVGICAYAWTPDGRHTRSAIGADDLASAVDEVIALIRRDMHAAQPAVIVELTAATAAYEAATARAAEAKAAWHHLIGASRADGVPVATIAAHAGVSAPRIYQILDGA